MKKHVRPGEMLVVRSGYLPMLWHSQDIGFVGGGGTQLHEGTTCIVIAVLSDINFVLCNGGNLPGSSVLLGWCSFDERWDRLR